VDPQQFGAGAGFPAWPPPAPPARPRRSPGRVLAAVVVVVAALGALGLGLRISGGAPAADAGARPGSGAPAADVAAQALWRTAPADRLLPPQLNREGTEAYYRLAVDPDESCARLPAAFRAALAPAGCVRLVQATYLDSTESLVATVGLVVTGGTAAQRGALFENWTADSYARQYAMMPSAYPVPVTLAARFGDPQRIAWMSGIANGGGYVAFTVAGFVDGRLGPTGAAFAQGNASVLSSSSPPVQAASDLPPAVLDALGALGAPAGSADGGQS
jgi:hypothetical protein